jgi:SAM-dependent methyltransferase
MTVPTEAVVWAYRLLLGREPESNNVIQDHAQAESLGRLREDFLSSQEFSLRYPNVALPSGVPLHVRARQDIEYQVDTKTLEQLREQTGRQWHALGMDKPHFSVLTHAKFLPQAFKDNEAAFWQSGYTDLNIIRWALEHADTELTQDCVAVELGCGVGRVSVPVSEKVSRLIAYDISRPHLDIAARHAVEVGRRNIEFRHHDPREPITFEPCDLFFSFIVLQHNAPPVIYAILDAAFSALRPGGIAVFQVPVFRVDYSFSAITFLAQPVSEMDMHCLPQAAIFELAAYYGLCVRQVVEDDYVGEPHKFVSNTFVMKKRR